MKPVSQVFRGNFLREIYMQNQKELSHLRITPFESHQIMFGDFVSSVFPRVQ